MSRHLSFLHLRFPKQMKQEPKDLAIAGFYYTGKADKCICYSCDITISQWKKTDFPADKHHPECKHAKNRMAFYPERMRTFKDYPEQLKPEPKDLAWSGFYYSGYGDKCICFSCGVCILDWEVYDNAMKEHSRHSPDCQHLKEIKNEGYDEVDQL